MASRTPLLVVGPYRLEGASADVHGLVSAVESCAEACFDGVEIAVSKAAFLVEHHKPTRARAA